jgi:hypothetical protein
MHRNSAKFEKKKSAASFNIPTSGLTTAGHHPNAEVLIFSRISSRGSFGAVAMCDNSRCGSVRLFRNVSDAAMSGIGDMKVAGLLDDETLITSGRPPDFHTLGFAAAQLRSSRKFHNFSS